MFENWGSLALGGVGGILTSSVVQYIRYYLDKRKERERREENWYMQVVTNTRALRRRAADLDSSIELPERIRTRSAEDIDNKELAQVVNLIEELRDVHDQMPVQFYGTMVDDELSEITRFYDSSLIGDEPQDVVEFKGELREGTKSTLDAIEEEFSPASHLY